MHLFRTTKESNCSKQDRKYFVLDVRFTKIAQAAWYHYSRYAYYTMVIQIFHFIICILWCCTLCCHPLLLLPPPLRPTPLASPLGDHCHPFMGPLNWIEKRKRKEISDHGIHSSWMNREWGRRRPEKGIWWKCREWPWATNVRLCFRLYLAISQFLIPDHKIEFSVRVQVKTGWRG